MNRAVAAAICCGLYALSAIAQDASSPASPPHAAREETSQGRLLSFDELVALSSTARPSGVLQTRLNALLTNPFVYNDAEQAAIPPHRPQVGRLGPVLRVAFWNIERGLNFELIRSALSGPGEFERWLEAQSKAGGDKRQLVDLQLRTLKDADVLVLNEVDLGMKRTEYRDVARDLATALHMNYAYAVEFVEVDPIFDLGTEQVHVPDAQQDRRLQQDLEVDRMRYKGLHGTAILSRYPIRQARIFPLPVCYDWYSQEAKAASKLEQGRRWSAHKLFRERIGREVRHGGRTTLVADIAVPEMPNGKVTIVALHLENKCPPRCRRKQMEALLAGVKSVNNPLILAGDLNTTSKNNTPTSVRNEIMNRVADYKFWIGQTVSYFHPLGIFKFTLIPVRYFHGYNDPTAFHVPVLWDNEERPLFRTLEKFRFNDGRSFDFRGLRRYTSPPKGRTLADSNARASKGFIPTYAFTRDFGGLVGRFKLDWLLVKPFVQNPRARHQSDRFAPHYAMTMRELNESVADRISDHAPMTADLPLLKQDSR
ncbi:MAG: endonuclease/exonuclease/phosphatase family protein [Acidobacteria bacterium]|nr:endonuclease/exonuclease/phosphatase family protein [Acidobacteriota bacterium]